jgi:uncharacterized protein YjbI with pentapeptide repeats
MGNGTKKNPYTREDVLRLIKENGDTARGLDLSGKVFEGGIDLRKLDLKGIILEGATFKRIQRAALTKKGTKLEFFESAAVRKSNSIGALLSYAHLESANLSSAHLEKAILTRANLEGANLAFANLEGGTLNYANFKNASLPCTMLYEAELSGSKLEGTDLAVANLERADLSGAHIERADLSDACLEGTILRGIEFPHDAKMEDVYWGNYILEEERWGEEERKEHKNIITGSFRDASATYRRLKIWYTEHGLYDIAGKFFYREMEAKRKDQIWKKQPLQKLGSWFLRILCGYGEKPLRVAISAAVVIFGLAIAYFLWGSFSSSSFADTLYYSVASFTALGYGQWAPQPTGWAKGVGAAEAVLGVSMLALFLVTFTRKMIR